MAGDWIKVRTCLVTHPTVLQIAESLGITEQHAIGCLVCLWSMADTHSTNGFIKGLTQNRVDKIVGKEGFAEACIKAGWLEVKDGGMEVSEFHRHNGESAKKRLQTAERVRRHRQKNPTQKVKRKCNANVTLREEKRREENIEDISITVSDPPPKPPFVRPDPPSRRLNAVNGSQSPVRSTASQEMQTDRLDLTSVPAAASSPGTLANGSACVGVQGKDLQSTSEPTKPDAMRQGVNSENATSPGMLIPEIEMEPKPKRTSGKSAKRKTMDVPPTMEQVRDYIKENKLNVFPEEFMSHYESNGWVQGNSRKPIVDWQAAVRGWHFRSKRDGTGFSSKDSFSGRQQSNGSQPEKPAQPVRSLRSREQLDEENRRILAERAKSIQEALT